MAHHDPRSRAVTLGVDVGTSSTKGVLVDADGSVVASAVRQHAPSRPRPGHVEMDAALWWKELVSIAQELTAGPDREVVGVGASGMGPCVLLTDAEDEPLRPAILYGVDTRSTRQIAELTERLGGADRILARCGSVLSSQAAGPKLQWVADVEPELFARARRLFMPSSWLVRRLTGAYVLDHHSASQCTPMYDATTANWYHPWADPIVGGIELPRLVWADTVVGEVTPAAAGETGLPPGIPVVAGTIDAWAEQVSVGAFGAGDLMLMYGTTMFLTLTVAEPLSEPSLWQTAGAFEGSRCLAGGMATSGALTDWLVGLTGAGHPDLLEEAQASPAGADGLLTLPYFAGERTPLLDPDARGVVAGLTLSHTRGDLYRSALEATAFGVRHHVEVMAAAGGRVERVVAVGGGAQREVWPQIVSDVTGLEQVVPRVTVGAAYGDAFLAARALAEADIGAWNPPARTCRPDPATRGTYDSLYALYRELYARSADVVHALAERQRGPHLAGPAGTA